MQLPRAGLIPCAGLTGNLWARYSCRRRVCHKDASNSSAIGVSKGERRLRQNPDIEASELNGELLLFNGATNKFFVMNPTAAFVWESIKQPTGEQELAAALCQRFSGTTKEQALVDVKETLKNMRELGLLLEQ
jgi:hypothetical protein